MFYGFTKFIYDRLPYFRYADDDHAGAETGTTQTVGDGETNQGGEDGGEKECDDLPARIKITSEEVRLDGVESITTYTSPTDPNSPRTNATPHVTVASNNYYRTGELLSYNERSGMCTVIDSHGNLVTIQTAGNPFKR